MMMTMTTTLTTNMAIMMKTINQSIDDDYANKLMTLTTTIQMTTVTTVTIEPLN